MEQISTNLIVRKKLYNRSGDNRPMGFRTMAMGQRCRPDVKREVLEEILEARRMLTYWVQDFINYGNGDYDNPDFKKLVARLKKYRRRVPV